MALDDLAAVKKQARIAGWLYFLTSLPAPFCLIMLPGRIYVAGDAVTTAAHLRTSESLVRLAMAGELVSMIAFVFVALALHKLFRAVSGPLALAMLTLILLSVPLSVIAVVFEKMALLLATGGGPATLDPRQADALAFLFYRLHGQSVGLTSIFWGLWLFPFAMLVIRSGFIPRWIGALMFFAGLSYPLDILVSILWPNASDSIGSLVRILQFGELPIIFWLMIWGARAPRAANAAAAA